MKIESLEECTGCHACFLRCPKSAISMQYSFEGFLYPQIDKSKCIECGECERTCPILTPTQNNNDKRIAFAAINSNDKVRLESSSGGMFTALAEKILAEGGVVFGAKFSDDFSVVHSWTDSSEELLLFRGSKYIQSEIGNTYRDCILFLEQGRKVLFTGTPCQIAGLKNVLKKDYDNLLLVDIVCHGVPSKLLWDKYKTFIINKHKSNLNFFSFRNKKKGWLNYNLFGVFNNGKVYSVNHDKDLFMNLYLSNNCLRKSCYTCQFKNTNSQADITLGDFWGINKVKSELFDNKGTSLMIVNTIKGENVVSKLEGCDIQELQYEDCIKYNPSVIYASKKGEKRDAFYKILKSLTFNRVVKKYGRKKDCEYYLRAIKRGIKKWIRR